MPSGAANNILPVRRGLGAAPAMKRFLLAAILLSGTTPLKAQQTDRLC